MAGERPAYIQSLRFSPQIASADRDRPFAAQSMLSSAPADDNDDDQPRTRMRKD